MIKLNVGYVNSERNSADLVSKYMKNSVEICNGRKYRNSPELSVLEMRRRTVLKYRTGQASEFNAIRFMALANQTGSLEMMKPEEKVEDVAYVVKRSTSKGDKSTKRVILVEKKAGKTFVGKLSKFQWKDAVGFFLRGNDQLVSLHFKPRFRLDLGDRMEHLNAHFYSFKSLVTVFFLYARRSESRRENQ